jgi:hypothetical protein
MSRVGITIEGGLFAADLIERIALGEEGIKGQSARDFDIEPGRLSAELQSAFSDVRQAWEVFKRRREFSQASPVTVTREAWIYPLFERLDYMLRFQRAASQAGGQSYLISHHLGEAESATPVHTVSFDQRLDERGGQQRSPHALLQEYLNRSDALWGIVTNGRELRLLRNSARSSRPSYLAIDLEAIVEGNLYSEFALVYRLLHRSRLPEDGGDPHDCLLETWYQQSIEEGGRVRLGLRVGVKAALEILGSGFLRHQGNDALRAKIADGRLTEAHLYRELLSLIYRLLFLMVAEERRLLAAPGADARHDVYLRWYGIGRLRERAERRVGEDAYGDLWEGLKETFRVFREEAAAAALGLSALNGELFGTEALRDLEDRDTRLRNDDLLAATRQLSMFEEKARGRRKAVVRRRVNYAGLDVEELGSIYESLLDYHPQVSQERSWGFALAAGSQRKETGSYYTPPELVRELIDSALVPVMQDRLAAAPSRGKKRARCYR